MADTTAPTPEQVVLGVALLLDGPDGPAVREQLLRIADLDADSVYARLLGQGDGADEQIRIARDVLSRIAPHYTADLGSPLPSPGATLERTAP